MSTIPPWDPGASLATIAESWKNPGSKAIAELDRSLPVAEDGGEAKDVVSSLIYRAMLLNSEGQPGRAYQALEKARSLAEADDALARKLLYTIVYFQGVTAMRRGENENCIECRGESSCILPIAPAAVHTDPGRLPAGHPALHRVPRPVPRRPGGPLAAQPRPHDPGRASREGRSPVPHRRWTDSATRSSTSASSATSVTSRASTASTRPAGRSWRTSTTTACSTWR